MIFISLMASDTEHVFLCTYWSSVCLLWSNVYLPIFNWVIYLFWMFHFIASYSCFMDQISSLLSLKDCLAIWSFLLPPALSVFPLSSLFLFVCLVCSLLHYRFFMNIWIFSHIKKMNEELKFWLVAVWRAGAIGRSLPTVRVCVSFPLDCLISPKGILPPSA